MLELFFLSFISCTDVCDKDANKSFMEYFEDFNIAIFSERNIRNIRRRNIRRIKKES